MKRQPLATLFPSISAAEFTRRYELGEVVVHHGNPRRLPAFLQSPRGELSTFERARELGTPFDVAYPRDDGFVQHPGSGSPQPFYSLGATVRFTSLDAAVPAAKAWLDRLCAELGVPLRLDDGYDANLNGWASTESEGLSYHYDAQEVILIQLVGNKRLTVAPNLHARFPDVQFKFDRPVSLDMFPIFSGGFPRAEPTKGTHVELAPGSVIFLPRGTWHRSKALDQNSFAVAIVLRTPTTLDAYLSFLRRRLRYEPEWRRPLHLFAKGPRRKKERDRIDALLRPFGEELAQVRAEDVLHHTGQLGRDTLGPASRYTFHISPTARATVETKGRRLEVQIAAEVPIDSEKPKALRQITASFQLDREFQPAMKWLATRRSAFSLDELCKGCPQVSRDELAALLDQLAALSYVVVMPFPVVR